MCAGRQAGAELHSQVLQDRAQGASDGLLKLYKVARWSRRSLLRPDSDQCCYCYSVAAGVADNEDADGSAGNCD